jgi:histidinol-phosphate aminotransferase
MLISRRKVLHEIGAGAIAAVTLPAMAASYLSYGEHAAGTKETREPIHLDRNENPYGAPESAIGAMRNSLGGSNRYPYACDALRQKIADHHRIKPDQIVLGCGSTEVLRMAADAFLLPGKKLIQATPTCPLLASFARRREAEVVEVPLANDHAHDLQAMLDRSDDSTGLVYVCNPNNPTGTFTLRHDLEEFLRKLPSTVAVVIDEAYHHYVAPTSSYASFLDRPVGDDRTIVTRTFSTIYGLAGLRIGYAATAPVLARRLSAFGLQFGENAVAISAAMAALDDGEHVRRSAQRNRDDRQRFFNHADARYAQVRNSQTNFVLVKLDHPIEEVIAHFRRENVLVGPRLPGLDNYLRVSIGRPEEQAAFWRVWDMLPHDSMKH